MGMNFPWCDIAYLDSTICSDLHTPHVQAEYGPSLSIALSYDSSWLYLFYPADDDLIQNNRHHT